MLIMSRDGKITREATTVLQPCCSDSRRHPLVRLLAALWARPTDQQRLDAGTAPCLAVMMRNGTVVG